MKTKHLLFAITIATILLSATSCKKDDVVYPEQSFFHGYLSAAGFTKVNSYHQPWCTESGVVFTPLVKGKINAFKVRFPWAEPTLKIRIWDFETQKVLVSYPVNYTTPETEYKLDITPLALEKNKKYVFTTVNFSYYAYVKPDYSAAAYPITVNEIRIDSWNSSGPLANPDTPVFPTNIITKGASGDLDFNFQRTE